VDPAQERRVLDAFDAAVDWPEAEREARLAVLLAAEPDVLKAVWALFAAERNADLMPTRAPEHSPIDTDVSPPERAGAYRLTELIGRGGMGSVYRGERIKGGFEQTVAIKLIQRGLFTTAAAAQFAQERQILARLHHPHITQLYDGGLTEGGQSYIVMELVQGAPIMDHIQARGLDLKRRLDLFADVCGAIDYAHSQGVVHADIKPSNIIIDAHHGVKLLDFGISGLIGEEGPLAGLRAATPAYASPQQAAHAVASAADDVYSLGVLLQVLAGDQAGFDAELAAVAAKARAAEPADRYRSAQDIANDIGRWRRMEPVSALPARALRGVWFFWRRNRLAVSLSAAAALGLVVAVAVMSVLYVQANAARRQSDQRFQEVRALSRYMLSDLTGALEEFPGTGPLRNDLAHRGRVYLEGLSQIPRAPADIRLEVAQGYAKTGEILSRLGSQNEGDPNVGKADLAKAERGLRNLLSEPRQRDDAALALSRVLVAQARIAYSADNQPQRATPMFAEACALASNVIAQEPRSAKAHLAHLDCLLGRSNMLSFQGRYSDVLAQIDAVMAEVRAMPPGADATALALDEAKALNQRGDAQYYLGNHSASLQPFLDAAAVLERVNAHAADVRVLDLLAHTTYNIASTLDDLGRKGEELGWIDRGVAAADQMRTFEDTPQAWRTVTTVHMQRASTLAALGRFDEAITEATSNLALRRSIAAHSPHDNLSVRAVPVALRPLGDIYWAAGRRAQACAAYSEAKAQWNRLTAAKGVLGSDQTGEIPMLDELLKRCAH
jgi:serine/threonine-protein kinase